ncbi:chemotaxis-specific protein-glutamate methyltransferase CheB [Pseudokineococcus basanitobsidens]|uniref:Protein-glutamate methylesterase/protein-glutamine glutaminase n=1 Tax=Pseudokineococcus basanitobsidens TaxID=1926649 RepID=A0ABU8RG39_9ACTN
MQPIRVLVVDDSAVLRRLVVMALTSADGVEVVGTAADGVEAVHEVLRLAPDLVVMDLEMPELDGIGAVRVLRRRGCNVPVVMVSTPTDDGAQATMAALAAGAADFVPKPVRATSAAEALGMLRADLLPVVRALVPRSLPRAPAAGAPAPSSSPDRTGPDAASGGGAGAPEPGPAGDEGVARGRATGHGGAHRSPVPPVPVPRSVPSRSAAPGPVLGPPPGAAPSAARPSPAALPGRGPGVAPALVALGSSTGGPEALAALVAALPAGLPVPVVVTQHMPPVFTRQLAARLDRLAALEVREAEDGDPLVPGRLLVAPGDRHLEVRRDGAGLVATLTGAPPVHHCRPAVDVMLRSAASAVGSGVLAVVLTGMGSDGRDGCADVRRAGGRVLVQDRATSVVWGMPGAVASAGLADAVLPLADIAPAVAAACRRPVLLAGRGAR